MQLGCSQPLLVGSLTRIKIDSHYVNVDSFVEDDGFGNDFNQPFKTTSFD